MDMTRWQSRQRTEREGFSVRIVVLSPAKVALQQDFAVTEANVDAVFLQVIQTMYRDLHHTPGLREAQVKASRYTQEACVVVIEEWQTLTHLQQALLQHEWQSAFGEIQPILARSATVLGPYPVPLAEIQSHMRTDIFPFRLTSRTCSSQLHL